MTIKTINSDLDASQLSIAIVAARFNEFVVDKLLAGAIAALQQQGVSDQRGLVVRVPGAYELPVAAKALAESGKYDAIVALGAVIRGATAHFDFVAGECARGLTRVSLDSGVPIAFGVLTTDTAEQALERAGVVASVVKGAQQQEAHVETLTGNKGADAALCAIEMANLRRALRR